MCIAFPMTVTEVKGDRARVASGERAEEADVSLIEGEVRPGDILLVFRGAAIRRIDSEEAVQINAALQCLGDVLEGAGTESVDEAFSDILENTGKLPEHLQRLVPKAS